ncbi:MAG: xanthine dehydrogenase family protein molybdopterin-binding subunit [Deltaproteobacteria bacterium]|nr:xanthine dehydrogenase family protein molybdopterin-binding subunit [Deltaproteobacteria bacterium]
MMLKGKVGESIPRVDTMEKVLGKALFAADLKMEGLLHMKVLRSDRPHARIKKIHTEKAEAMPGVVRIFTHRDIPGKNQIGIIAITKDQHVLAEDRVRFIGDPIALVVAHTEREAEQTLEEIRVEYEDLPPIFDPEEALRSPTLIHEKGNLLYQRDTIKGNVEQGFAESDLVIERTYLTSMLEHTYLEPDAGVAWVDEEGRITVYPSTQNPHYDHMEIVAVLGVEPSQARVIQATTGGGFGSKLDISVQCFLALAIYHLRRPVRLVYTREEAYLATAKRHPLIMRYKTGARRDGRLVAVEADILGDTGAYASYGVAVASRAAVHATGPYQVPHVRVKSKMAYTNHPFSGAMRGFGVPQVAFAHESQMDILAEELGMDPFEIRLLNAFDRGSETATGQTLKESVGIKECLQQVKEHRGEIKSNPGRLYGKGIGAMWYGIGNTGLKNPASARAELDHQGRFTLFTGAAEIGQGSDTVLSQIAASEMGIDTQDIRLVRGDTALTLDAGATSASRQTYISGNAVYEATDKLKGLVLEEASRFLKVPAHELTVEDGLVKSQRDGEIFATLKDVAARSYQEGKKLMGEGFFDPPTTTLDAETGQGIPYATYAFACQMAEVEVDPATGEVDVLRVVAAHDVGKAVNPSNVVGQIASGVAMGIGFALMEEFVPGQTRSMRDYLIPSIKDIPEVIPIIVEDPEPTGPFGAKGVGEPALIPTAPAILNAIAHALGERIYHLPASLERVLEASRRKLGSSNKRY